jgi:hypothetical protein
MGWCILVIRSISENYGTNSVPHAFAFLANAWESTIFSQPLDPLNQVHNQVHKHESRVSISAARP